MIQDLLSRLSEEYRCPGPVDLGAQLLWSTYTKKLHLANDQQNFGLAP